MLGSLSITLGEDDKTSIAILDGSRFGLQFLHSESHSWEVTATSHPVESGSEITDHIQPQPRTVTISARESDAPLNIVDILGRYGTNRVQEAKLFLLELYQSKKPVMVTTRLHTYPRMIATSITQGLTAGDGKSLPWSVTLREIEIADTSSVQLGALPVPQAAKTSGAGSKTVNAGKKAPVPATPAEVKKMGSLAFEYKDAFLAMFGM